MHSTRRRAGPRSQSALRCATDVTGFGLLGHASHIARASNVTIRVRREAVPIFDGVREAARAGCATDGGKRNAEYLRDLVRWTSGSDADRAVFTIRRHRGVCSSPCLGSKWPIIFRV